MCSACIYRIVLYRMSAQSPFIFRCRLKDLRNAWLQFLNLISGAIKRNSKPIPNKRFYKSNAMAWWRKKKYTSNFCQTESYLPKWFNLFEWFSFAAHTNNMYCIFLAFWNHKKKSEIDRWMSSRASVFVHDSRNKCCCCCCGQTYI